jgi:hypothetical protein
MSDKEQLKRKLKSYIHLKAEQKQIAEELARVEAAMASPRGSNMDSMPRSHGAGDPVLAIVAQHIALQQRYNEQLEKLAAAQLAIEDMIESLEPL